MSKTEIFDKRRRGIFLLSRIDDIFFRTSKKKKKELDISIIKREKNERLEGNMEIYYGYKDGFYFRRVRLKVICY